ncbi:MAG: SDR family NAD(P)-dependent oxidoreductase, partial [Nanoarchaeota archaeon]
MEETKNVVVTGCMGGIGSGTCEYFHNLSWNVIGIDKVEGAVPSYINEFYKCDLAREDEIREVFQKIKDKYHSIHALVNNAALQVAKPLLDTTVDEWDA